CKQPPSRSRLAGSPRRLREVALSGCAPFGGTRPTRLRCSPTVMGRSSYRPVPKSGPGLIRLRSAGGRRRHADRTGDEQAVFANDRQREVEAIDLAGELRVPAWEPRGPVRILMLPELRDGRGDIGRTAGEAGSDVLGAGLVL